VSHIATAPPGGEMEKPLGEVRSWNLQGPPPEKEAGVGGGHNPGRANKSRSLGEDGRDAGTGRKTRMRNRNTVR